MKTKKNSSNPPSSFTTLTEIMERFQTVPYDQFQQELQSWFEQDLAQNMGLPNTKELHESPGFQKLLDLISSIYHQAEVSQTLTDAQIQTSDERK